MTVQTNKSLHSNSKYAHKPYYNPNHISGSIEICNFCFFSRYFLIEVTYAHHNVSRVAFNLLINHYNYLH